MENIDNIFNINRVVLLLKRYYTFHLTNLLTSFGVVTMIMALICNIYFHSQVEAYVDFFEAVLIIGGLIMTSKAFDETHVPAKSIHYLTLPASKYEKFFFSWLNTTIIFLLASLVFFYLSYFMSAFMTSLVRSIPVQFFNIFDYDFLDTITTYLLIQPVFFLGAIAFKKANFIKTCLSILLLAIGLCIFAVILFLLFYGFSRPGGMSSDDLSQLVLFDQIGSIVKYAYWIIMGPWMLFIAFLKFQEKEI